jgi:hypothetical protein
VRARLTRAERDLIVELAEQGVGLFAFHGIADHVIDADAQE